MGLPAEALGPLTLRRGDQSIRPGQVADRFDVALQLPLLASSPPTRERLSGAPRLGRTGGSAPAEVPAGRRGHLRRRHPWCG